MFYVEVMFRGSSYWQVRQACATLAEANAFALAARKADAEGHSYRVVQEHPIREDVPREQQQPTTP